MKITVVRSWFLYGYGSNKMLSVTLKMTVVAPIPSARARIDNRDKRSSSRRLRRPNRRSRQSQPSISRSRPDAVGAATDPRSVLSQARRKGSNLKFREGSFVPQGHQRIHAHGAARGDVTA